MSTERMLNGLSAKLIKIRESFNQTITQMAQQLRIYRGNLVDYEKSKSMPSLSTLHRLGICYGVSLNWFILDKGPMFLSVEEDQKNVSPNPLDELENPLSGDTVELLKYMDKIPLLRHEILVQFHRFKEEHREMVKEAFESKPSA